MNNCTSSILPIMTPTNGAFYVWLYNKTSDKTAIELVQDITYAIKFWNNELEKAWVNIRVARTPTKMNNHIKISFADDKTAPKKFGKSMAYTFSPSDRNSRHEWQIFVNDKFDRAYENLRSVLVHEIWHALWVKHIEDKKCVMYFQNLRENEIKLSEAWTNQLKALYSQYCK